MGKTFLTNYTNIVLKNQKSRIRKAATKQIAEKRHLKRRNSDETESELPFKKIKTCPENISESEIDLEQDTTAVLDDDCELVLNNGSSIYLQVKDSDKGDLFFDDELKSTYFKNLLTDFYVNIVEEISLEGLDGITTECLWKRLFYFDYPILLNNNLKEIIWKIICQNSSFQFYELPVPREELKILNQLDHINSVGVILEMVPQEQELYPVDVLNIPNIQGSCSTYHSRIDISEVVRNRTYNEVEKKYGRKLVIVANQSLRRITLMENADPLLELQNVEYCMLERIGRARKFGVLTQGNMSLANQFQMDSKSVFHYKKHMLRHGLIEKQFFYIRSVTSEQNKTGRLIHLRKFFHRVKSNQLLFLEQIVNILKCQPNYRMPTMLLKKHFTELSVKLTKSSVFRRFIKCDSVYPYRTIFPNAQRTEYMKKNALKGEKGVRCYELIDPHINVIANYRFEEDVDSDDDEDEEGEEELGGNKIYNLELFREIYLHILAKGREGCTSKDISRLVSVDRNSIRMALKKLVSKNVVHIRRIDVGKQRMLTYYPKYLDHDKDPVVFNTFPVQTSSDVKERLKQRQKTAIERQRQANNENKNTSSMEVDEKIDKKKIDQDMQIKCEYFINNFSDFPQPLESNNFDVSSILTTKIYPLKLLKFPITEDDLLVLNTDLESSKIYPALTFGFSENSLIIIKKNVDYVSKLILLKAMFNEIKLENINSVTRKRKISTSSFLMPQNNEQSGKKLDNLQVMGNNPVIVYGSNEDQIDVTLMVSTPPEKYSFEKKFKKPSDMSDRVASRIQIILDEINERKIFEDKFRLIKVIVEKELQEGYQRKIDRKSLARILIRLVQDGYIRIYNLIVTDGKLTKSQFFICHPSITYADNAFETATQQIKFRYFVQKKKCDVVLPIKNIPLKSDIDGAPSPFKEIDVMESITQLNDMKPDKEISPPALKFVRSVAKIRGLKPKFIRMRIFHELLFFLIYDYSASGKPLSNSEVRELFLSNYINLSDEDVQAMPKIYFKELSWKMFIPPLPHHKGWSEGWALMCDIILRMPISVFCKVHSVTVKSPDLEELLNHPIKRFYLLKDITFPVRNAIFFKRKYLMSIFDSLNRLAFCGLIQMGPQKRKEKDQSFIYLNRRATLLDTKTSEPGYNKISKQNYSILKFYFNSTNDLDEYWYQMYFISLNTKLNQRRPGTLVTYTHVSAKPDLMEALSFRTEEEAKLKDNGQLPGDNRGAAGLDSALWVHIAKNWFWAKVKRKESKTPAVLGLEREKLSVGTNPISYKDLRIKSNSNKIYLLNATKTDSDTTKKKDTKVLVHSVPAKPSKKQQKFVKRIPKRIKVKRQCKDHMDRMISKRNGAQRRVQWSNREDHCLMLCKVGDLFLNPNSRGKQHVYNNIIRDVLHRVCPSSKDKTSMACQRRIKTIFLKKYRNLREEVANLLLIDEISNHFLPLISMMREREIKVTEKEYRIAFVFLVHYIFQHEDKVNEVLEKGSKIDHLSPRNLPYTENNLIENIGPLKFMDPLNEDDIKKDVLKTVIHSTLTSRNQPDWSLQLFKIYQKYPDELIKSAVEELKSTQTISCRKFDVKRNRISWQIPFKLSQSYIYFQFTTFNKITALEAYKTFLALKNNTINSKLDFSKDVVESKKYGQLLGISEFYTFWQNIRFNIELPQYTIILDPNIKDHSGLIHALALRMRLHLKKIIQETNAEEEQEEQDIDNEHFSTTDEQDFEDNQSINLSRNIHDTDAQSGFIHDVHSNPLDLNTEIGNTETIDQLKNWVTDCMERDRSPSPEFMRSQDKIMEEYDEIDHTRLPKLALEDTEQSHRAGGKTFPQGYIPTLEEIKEEMLRPPVPNEDRIVPYITELSDLLNKESFTELKTDEETLEELNAHFITQYPLLESLSIEERDRLQEFYFLDYLHTHSKNANILKKIQSEMLVGQPSCQDNDRIFQLIMENEGTHEDVLLSNEIIEYVLQKEICGATAPELRERFSRHETNLSLTTILKILEDTKIIIRVGICTLTFVHYKHQLTWLVETFHLTSEEHANIRYQENEMETVQKQLSQKKLIRIKVAPWTQINGTINYQTLNNWLSSVLSHCLEYPKITLMKLCEKFCYLKPVDVFTLLETLEEMGCLELVVYGQNKPTLFSSWEPPERRNANFLDDFKDIVIETNSVSMTILGSFLYDNLDKCDS